MRKKFTICFIMVLTMLGVSTLSQGQGFYNTVKWKFSNPKQFGFTVLDVDYFDNNNVIAVGGNGGIAKSTDAGKNWQYGPFTFINAAGLQTASNFSDVHYITANIAYAVGDRGCMAKTTDGGLNWSFVNTPLFVNTKNINTVWFLNKDTGYIGGQFNTPDSLPKLYITKNGGSTWDSIAAPLSNGKTRVGYINNPNIPSVLYDINAKAKEIYRIEFINDSTGYVCGSGSPLFPRVSSNAVAATCLPSTGNLTTGSHSAGLLWKIKNGVITDYSLSKERMGYSGINTNTVTCTTGYGSVNAQSQTYRAMSIISDSVVVLMSFNNNAVVRVNTGTSDSTENLAIPGVYEKGKFFTLNYPFPPTGGPNAGPPIPNPQVLLASNPYQIKKAASGKLYAGGNFGRVWTSIDTGRNWIQERSYPEGTNFSAFAAWALDIAPNGRFLFMGSNGAVADSMPGGALTSNYVTVAPAGGYSKIAFADCNNGMAVGGGYITVTTDGGATWLDKNRPDFISSFYSINSVAYPSTTKSYFAVSNGVLYNSADQGTTLDPLFSDFNFQMNDVAAIGNDTIMLMGYSSFSIPAASRKSTLFRSVNGGVSFQAIDIAASTATPAFTAPTLSQMSFANHLVGYVAGSRNGVYKTTDGGTTWTSINPFPALNQFPTGFPNTAITYTEIFALDANTVFVVGNMFTNTGIKRVYKTTDGGATWADITGNIPAIFPVGNITGVLFHDANNGYIIIGSTLIKTTDGGTNWAMDISPTGLIFQTLAFAPAKVPAGITMANRKLFATGFGINSSGIMEYGNPANITVNATETIVNATCTNPSGGSITLNATGAIAPYTYSINGGTFQTSNIFNGLTQGVKTITIKDAFCGTLTKTITVGFTDNLTVTAAPADTSVCAGAPVQFRTTSSAATYAWSPAAGLSNAAISNPIAIVNSNSTYTVTATLNTCVKTATVNITIRPNPVVTAGPDKTIVDGADVMLQGSATGNTVSVLWSPAATLTGANTFTPTAKPSVTTTYTMTVNNSQGCTSTDNATVTVIPYCVKVMNAFTPNGDAINDRWLVTNGAACTNQVMVKVFNRYGSEVYTNDNYQNNWDGTYKGKAIPDGTYYYVISFRLISGRIVSAKGDVTILR